MVVTRRLLPPVEAALKLLVVAACYYVAGRIGLLSQVVVEGVVVTPIWPPTGVAVAALLMFGVQVWPGIALGSFLVIASIVTPQMTTLVNVAGNTLAPLCAYFCLRRIGFRLDISRLRDGLALVFLGGLGAMLISATIGVGVQAVNGDLDRGEFWAVWLSWWVGDAMGVLLVTPLLLLLVGVGRAPWGRRWLEAACLAVAALVIVPLGALGETSLLFLVFPLLIWAALRFQLAGSTLCALFSSVLTTYAANTGKGAFLNLSKVEIMVKLQAFNGATALTALLLSALVTEQIATRRSVQSACDELAEVLDHLAAGEMPPEVPPRHLPDPSRAEGDPA
ncbi:MASE1 domain-containing protein [Streptomyces sp. NPDC059524]|uniref:MASE1 domain-containing protein n=1 Tax=Streptomyces sp. NPDC059524 TaxID=3346856 RepID=UPI0036AD7E27